MIISKRLKWLRSVNRYTQKEIAVEIGLTLNGYQKIEYGEREPKIEGLIGLANFYNVSTDFLIGLDDHTADLQAKYQKLLGYKMNLEYLTKAYSERVYYNRKLSDEQKVELRNLFDDLCANINDIYRNELRSYINEIIFVPDFNPYRNDILKDVFPIKFLATKEDNGSYIVRTFDKNGFDIESINEHRYIEYKIAQKAEEIRNSLVKKFWIDGVEPEHNEYQTYLF